MSDERDEIGDIVSVEALPIGRIGMAVGWEGETGKPLLVIELNPRDGTEWPWGGTAPLTIGLDRARISQLLSQLVEAGMRVYDAQHGQPEGT